MRMILPLTALALLAACSQPAPPPANEAGANDVVANDVAANKPVDNVAIPSAAPIPPFAETPNAHPTAPEPAPIPAKFRGTWAESKSGCADLKHPSRLGISGRTVRFPTFVIFGDSFTFPTPSQFALKGKVEATGAPAEAHYSINAAGNVLTDEAGGGAVRVRCG